MKNNNDPQDGPQLSSLLRQVRISPDLPPRFQQAVWRRIEDTEAAEAPARLGSWLDALVNSILRPRLAIALTAILLVAGAAVGTLQGQQMARHAAQSNYLASVAPAEVR
jgi:hypothetical protein